MANEANEPVWLEPKKNERLIALFEKEFNIHPVTAQVLTTRGFETPEQIHDFLYAKLPNLHAPNLFKDMDKAVQRIYEAFQRKESILIYGDNDVDGMTGTTLLIDFFRNLGANVFFYLPNRNSLKKNPIKEALEFAKQNECRLIITVDCGITGVEDLKAISDQNVDLIITDHHEPTDKLPHCIATLNPKLLKSTYPNRNLTGVGVAFKLAHAYTNYLISKEDILGNYIDLKQYLDLVALGTIADMGALTEENRILVRYGLIQMQKTHRIGLVKLVKVCGLKIQDVTTMDIASKIAPRLNSLGRIADPIKGIELLITRDSSEAEKLAKELDLRNLERQQIEKKDSEDVEQMLASNPDIFKDKAIVIYSENWHPGIIPIITARIAKQYNRPTIIIALENDIGKGSIRTIPEFPVLSALKECADLLINYGGHDYAAGLTISRENIETFKQRFLTIANKAIEDKDIYPKLQIDANAGFKDLTFDFLESLSLLEPFGNENPAPVFYCEAKQVWPPKVVGKTHLKLFLEESDRFLEGIGFNMASRKQSLLTKNLKLRIAFTPHVNNYLNKSSIQLQIRDFKIIEE
ncbi:MAG: single-stranded-DNA-specific exonuclease RecJ [Simkaniaceae bacterium]|nr:single-stranded-DNA-specific exonuclease RecJ [Simkaniaceae bacterium]